MAARLFQAATEVNNLDQKIRDIPVGENAGCVRAPWANPIKYAHAGAVALG